MARILIVDESLLDRKRVATVLEAVGYQVVEAASITEARRRLSAQPRGSFHLIITELNLPDGNGLEFLRELRQEPLTAGVPLLVVTPTPERERVVEVILAGAENIVAKPFAGEVILRRVTEAFSMTRLVQQAESGSVSWTLEEYLRREVKRAERTRLPLTVMAVVPGGSDQGPETRAALLKALGSRQARLRETDLVFGLNNGPVVVVLPDTDPLGAHVVESRIRHLLLHAPEAEGISADLLAGFSVGVANMPEDGADPELLLQTAVERAEVNLSGGEVLNQ